MTTKDNVESRPETLLTTAEGVMPTESGVTTGKEVRSTFTLIKLLTLALKKKLFFF